MQIRYTFIFAILFSAFTGCENNTGPTKSRIVVLQPFSNFPSASVDYLQIRLNQIFDSIVIQKSIPLPQSAFYAPRNRYRAENLISFLKERQSGRMTILGLTNHDVSVTKGPVKDWGVMGLGYQPGPSCIVSTFRLRGKLVNLFKVSVHELGHTEGLPHCKIKSCYMRDAEGGYPLDDETSFCTSCHSFLVRKGWRLR